MDVQVTSTGRVLRRIDNGTALLLLEAFPSVFERIDDNPLPKPGANVNLLPEHWTVGLNHLGIRSIILTAQGGRLVIPYGGPPDRAAAFYKQQGKEVPNDILEQYRRAYEVDNKPAAARTDAEISSGRPR